MSPITTLAFHSAFAAMVASSLIVPLGTAKAEGISNRTIGYVLTHKAWAVYQTPSSKEECPDGLNDGPREQFAKLFPDDGKKRSLLETHLAREADILFPATSEPLTANGPLQFIEVSGNKAIGLNLDGEVGANDFTSIDGEPGIDNQMYRVQGCVAGFRGPDGAYHFFQNEYMKRYNFNRVLIEITGVDDLVNDDDVVVTTYRGNSSLVLSANGKDYVAGGTQVVDSRWGKRYIFKLKGKIVDGVLTTDPADILVPYADTFNTNVNQPFKAARFRLRLTPKSAEGLLGAYVDLDAWQRQLTHNWGATHHASYGQMAIASIVRASRRLADAYPDPITGKNTAISSAHELKFVQAFILHAIESPKLNAEDTVSGR